MSTIAPVVKDFIETHIKLLRAEDYERFFETAQETFIPQTTCKIGEVFTAAGIDVLSQISFIPEGFFMLSLKERYTVPANIVRICYKAFMQSDLVEITIPGNVIEICEEAFSACYDLKTVHLSEGLEILGAGAFEHCDELTTIMLPKSLRVLGDNVFYSCDNLAKVEYAGTTDDCLKIKNITRIDAGAHFTRVYCSDGYLEL